MTKKTIGPTRVDELGEGFAFAVGSRNGTETKLGTASKSVSDESFIHVARKFQGHHGIEARLQRLLDDDALHAGFGIRGRRHGANVAVDFDCVALGVEQDAVVGSGWTQLDAQHKVSQIVRREHTGRHSVHKGGLVLVCIVRLPSVLDVPIETFHCNSFSHISVQNAGEVLTRNIFASCNISNL